MRNTLLALVITLATGQGHAEDKFTGHDLLANCREPRNSEAYTLCKFYSQGVVSALHYAAGFASGATIFAPQCSPMVESEALSATCPPSDYTRTQVAEVVRKWLEDNPAMRGHRASTAVVRAVTDAWPCD